MHEDSELARWRFIQGRHKGRGQAWCANGSQTAWGPRVMGGPGDPAHMGHKGSLLWMLQCSVCLRCGAWGGCRDRDSWPPVPPLASALAGLLMVRLPPSQWPAPWPTARHWPCSGAHFMRDNRLHPSWGAATFATCQSREGAGAPCPPPHVPLTCPEPTSTTATAQPSGRAPRSRCPRKMLPIPGPAEGGRQAGGQGCPAIQK